MTRTLPGPRGAGGTAGPAPDRVAGVVLAAGASRRFGTQKLLASFAGKPLVRWAVERVLASPVTTTLVVLGRDAPAVEAALGGLPVWCVVNDRYEEGMSTSVHAAVRALSSDPVQAAVFALGDQPRVPTRAIERLVAAFRATGASIVVPVYVGGERGHPVLFAAHLFPELLAVRGDEGGRSVIARDPTRVTAVPFDVPPPGDVDTPEDLAAAAP